jgi:hypothetical protein
MNPTFQHASVHPAWEAGCGLCDLARRDARLRPLLWAPGAAPPPPAPAAGAAPGRAACAHLGRRVRLEGGAVKRKLCRTG